jgi:hypothetical protein
LPTDANRAIGAAASRNTTSFSMRRNPSHLPRRLVWIAVCLLFVLHHDFWWWDDRSLVFGCIPVGLFYHAVFSLAASLVWLCSVKFAWPDEIEAWAAQEASTPVQEAQPDARS